MNIIELAKQANGEPAWSGGIEWHWDELQKFADLVLANHTRATTLAFLDGVAHEREACAQICDSFYLSWIDIQGRYEFMGEGASECAGAIRARGTT
jgi:hypothetical protein